MDPDQQQHLAGMMAGFGAMIFLFAFAVIALLIFLFWRVFTKAGLAGPLALLVLIPGVGWIIVLCILAFARWNVVPAPPQYGALPPGGYPPQFPPQTPTYPPQNLSTTYPQASGSPPQGPV